MHFPPRSILLAAVIAPTVVVQPASAAAHRFHADHVLGTSMDLTVFGASLDTAGRALAAAQAEIERLEEVLSGWRGSSEIARLNAASGPVPVSEDLYRVIAACERWRTLARGGFSARLGAVEAAWRAAEAVGVGPDGVMLRLAADQAARAQVALDPVRCTIDRGGVVFATDALAKGYIIDAALAAAARAAPGAGLLLDIGGDLRCRGPAPEGTGWRIGLAAARDADNVSPTQRIAVVDRAVATSGPGVRDRKIGGVAYGHLLSPWTGEAVMGPTVTTIAARAADADALATALAVMPPGEGLTLAEALPGMEARWVGLDGEVHATSGWAALLDPVPAPSAVLVRAAAARPWPTGFAVSIDYTIPEQSGYGRYRPPFVAIWITDERGDLVRTLFHLGQRPRRYLDSNYIWWRAFQGAGKADHLEAVTRPSRPPGKYTAVWDGRDDNGAAVDQGRYTINIETTREHAGHSYQQIPLVLGAKPVSGSAAAGEEAGPAAAHYGPTAAAGSSI